MAPCKVRVTFPDANMHETGSVDMFADLEMHTPGPQSARTCPRRTPTPPKVTILDCEGSESDSSSDDSSMEDAPTPPASQHRRRRASIAPITAHGWTFGNTEYDRSAIKVKLGDIQSLIEELDMYKLCEMAVHADSKCNTLTYRDAQERREVYTTSKFVFLALQKEILSKYSDITVEQVLDITEIDPINGSLMVV